MAQGAMQIPAEQSRLRAPAAALHSADLITAAVLTVGTWLTRWPFVGQILYHWDSINFALALKHFDVAASQPHVPGYPLYVLLGRLVSLAIPDPQHALAAISIVGGGLAVGALYLLGSEMFDRAVALVAALLLASSPLYWFYGEIALPHSLDAFVVVVGVWFLHRIARGDERLLVPAAAWLALAGGFRPQTQVFLMPLAALAVWQGWASFVRARRQLGVAILVLIVVDLAWFVPLVVSTGGLGRYLEITRDFYLSFNETTSIVSGGGLWGLRRNAIKLVQYTLYAWAAGLPLLLAGLLRQRAQGISLLHRFRGEVAMLALWVLPTLAYYQLIHMGQQGLVFVYLPALCLISAAVLAPLSTSWRWIALAAVAANASIFLFAPTFPLGGDRPKLLTADTLRWHDQLQGRRIDAVRSRFSPEHAFIVSAEWRFPQYYLPAYPLVRYGIVSRWEKGEGESKLRDQIDLGPRRLGVEPDEDGNRYAVLFDEALLAFSGDAERTEWVDLDGGDRMAVLRLRPGEGLRLQPDSFAITPPGPRAQDRW